MAADKAEKKKTRKRVAFDFTPEGYEALTALKNRIGASSNGELMKTALRFLSKQLERKNDGYEHAIIKDGKTIYIEIV